MAIRSYEFDAQLSAAFVAFREDLYGNDFNWMPPSRPALLAQFAPAFPFFQKGGNHHVHFMATANGRIVGHISAFVNSALKDRDDTPVGALGFFECVDDYQTAADLLEHAVEWLQHKHGLHRVWAPLNFDIWHGYRFMTRGFEEKAFYGEPYNKPYYPGFFNRFGFSVKKTWDSLERWSRPTLESMIAIFEPRYQKLLDEGYQFQSIDVDKAGDLHQLHTAVVRSYYDLLVMTPVDFDDFERIVGQYLKVFEARFVNLVYNPNGNIAGFSVAYPDYSDAVRAINVEHDVWTRLQFRFHRPRANRAVFYMIGATPEEIEKRHGVGGATYYHTMRQILAAGLKSVLFAIIADDSGGRKHLGAEMRFAQKTYTLYELNR